MPKNTSKRSTRVHKPPLANRHKSKSLVVLTQADDGSLALRADIPLGPRLLALLRKLWTTLLTLIAGAAAGRIFWQ